MYLIGQFIVKHPIELQKSRQCAGFKGYNDFVEKPSSSKMHDCKNTQPSRTLVKRDIKEKPSSDGQEDGKIFARYPSKLRL